ncbi:MAG: hypothetical protein CMA34_03530 [Euryarchaeota archaeon]|nr:hypothetical protein [Euryarchaeota archaeon]
MVIAFERKGAIDEDLKIIKAIQNELNLGNDEKSDALEHIKKFRGTGDWSGKRDAVVSVAIDRIEEAIDEKQVNNPSIINALTKLINVTLDQQKPSNDSDPLAAFEEEEEEVQDSSLKFGLDDEEEEEEEIIPVELVNEEKDDEESLLSQDSFSLGETEEEELDDDEEIDPFDLIGGREPSNSGNNESTYKDPLEELMDEVDDEEIQVETIELGSDDDDDENEPIKEDTSENQIIEMYRMMLDTVWVDDVIDPSEVALLARKRKDLDISFETHMKLVREMLEDSN